MKILALCLLLCASVASAEEFAPNPRLEATLTGNSQTINMTGGAYWGANPTAACPFRVMSTATKVGIKHTAPANVWTIRKIGKGSAFVNFSCPGTLQRQ